MILAIVDSINGVSVRLTEERWEHILDSHLELSDSDMDLILDAVKDPEYILSGYRMEKVVGKEQKRTAGPSESELMGLARERVALPNVDIDLDYQDDVDTLIIRFKKPVSEGLLECLDDESGVLPIYDPALTQLIGIEILDICGQLQYADPT
jgi:hypothetical protein